MEPSQWQGTLIGLRSEMQAIREVLGETFETWKTIRNYTKIILLQLLIPTKIFKQLTQNYGYQILLTVVEERTNICLKDGPSYVLIFHFLVDKIRYNLSKNCIPSFLLPDTFYRFYTTLLIFPYYFYYFSNSLKMLYILLILFITYYLYSHLECKLQGQSLLSTLIDAFQISTIFLTHYNHLINIC